MLFCRGRLWTRGTPETYCTAGGGCKMSSLSPHLSSPVCRRSPSLSTCSHLSVDVLPVSPEGPPGSSTGCFAVQTESDLFLQLLVQLFQRSHFVSVLHQAAVQSGRCRTVTCRPLPGPGQHRRRAAPHPLQKHTADTQSPPGHPCPQAGGPTHWGGGAHEDATGGTGAGRADPPAGSGGWAI